MNHLGSLRVSLLLALGVVPVACGGTTQRGDDGGEGADSGTGASTGTGGSSTKGGTSSRAGGPGKMLPPTGGTEAGGTGSGGGSTGSVCTNPKLDPLTGLVYCDEGYPHRPKTTECAPFGGAPATGDEEGLGGAGGSADVPVKPRAPAGTPCMREPGGTGPGNCDQYELGYCSFEAFEECKSGCYVDQDCGAGFVCECGHAESPTGGECVAATCATDNDCETGYFCAPSSGICGAGPYACQTRQDECVTNEDCLGGTCSSNGKFRVCQGGVCGRPFLVEAAARVAPVVESAAWSDDTAPRVEHLTASQRRELAEHWTRLGQMEHASIAAFARFQLQLLALGAPPDLVEQCTRALADETAHTKLCFGIASAYAGHGIGPGPLDVSGSLEITSLADIVDLVIAEGCFGETSAAVEALEAADAATDPVIRTAYMQIARDEQRHAELAFRFVRWALERGGATVAERISAALRSPLTETPAARAVVVPCLTALIDLAAAA